MLRKKLNINGQHPRTQITEVIRRIYKSGLTTTTGGNISIREANGDIWVTPSAIDKGSLAEKDIIRVGEDGTIEGPHRPSSEFAVHKAIYEARPDIRSVIHAHPPALVSFSMVRKIPDTGIISQTRQVCGPIGYAKYAISGGQELGEIIATEFSKDFSAVIMENHGAVVGGRDLKDAYVRFETLEFAARTIINASTLGDPVFLTDGQIQALESQYPDDPPEQDHVEYSSDEISIRKSISDLVLRACEQGLMIGSYGTVSVRWHGNDFLITPRNIPRWEMSPEDIIQIRNGKREPGKLPSRALKLHEKIYQENPHIHSIILSQPPNIMTFGVSSEDLNVRTMAEAWYFLREVPKIDFGTQFSNTGAIAKKFSQGRPALIIRNDSIIVTGEGLLQTFDRLEIAEFTARSIIMGHPIGPLMPMNQDQIDELVKKFG